MVSPILSVKLKHAIANTCAENGITPEMHIKNILINHVKRGCSGFIVNPTNSSVVYVNTEQSCMPFGYLYRYADSIKDYKGYHNRYAKTLDELASAIKTLLEKTPAEAGDKRI